MKLVAVLTLAIIATASCRSVSANDTAVETSAGGLKLRQEARVRMEKERLTISVNKVRVEYEFRNTSPNPVVSEVAFPVPPMTYIFNDTGGRRDFNDFRIWIDGAPVSYKKEIRAFVKDREITAALKEAGITIETFADFDPDENGQLKQLKPEVRQKLYDLGALESSGDNGETMWPQWEAHLKYHWQQEFPPGTIVRIRHEYRPVLGGTPVQLPDFQQNFPQSCITPETSAAISRHVAKTMEAEPLSNNYFSAVWVDYILMTANSWQMPIKDFELVIETDKGDMATFCWDGDVERTSGGGYVARKKDFVPKKDLRVYFLSFW